MKKRKKKPSYATLERRIRALERLLQMYKDDMGEGESYSSKPLRLQDLVIMSVGTSHPRDMIETLPDKP